ncbi:hypothetical protein D3C80_1572110 [compost metagenome]
MAGQAVLLEQGKALANRIVGRHPGIGKQCREALFDRGQATDRDNLKRPLLRTNPARQWIAPDQVERPGTWLAAAQCWPRPGRVFDRQPGLRRSALQQRRSGHFSGKTIQRHGLQVVVRGHVEQRGQRHGAVVHGALVGYVLLDADLPCLRMRKQRRTVPLARSTAEFQVQLRRR